MFTRFVAVVVQTIFFVLVFAVGSFLPAISPVPMWRTVVSASHYFVLNGPLLAVVVLLIVLGIEAATKRLRSSGMLTVLSFVLAFVVALAMKLPLMDRTAP